MFDLITGQTQHMPRRQGVPILISTTAQALVASVILAMPYLYVTAQLPEVPSMMAFVATPPPPPPPPPPAAPAKPATEPVTRAKPNQLVAPVGAPPEVVPEPVTVERNEEFIAGGVEGGIPGGVFGGVVGGIPDVVPPPPPPPPVKPSGPVRIGGQLKAPELVRRVNPEYPAMATFAQIEGLVILEAVVGEDGHVDEVRVLRSAGYAGVLDRSAAVALRQWQYSPLLLNGRPASFVLTVTLSFSLTDAMGSRQASGR
jgi:periplasmic protein TonB